MYLKSKKSTHVKSLNPLLHSQMRLAIMTILLNLKSTEFSYLLENIETSKGNLSFQIKKLKENTVVVYSYAITNPVAQRFGWVDNPDNLNLYNLELLPSTSFITDD